MSLDVYLTADRPTTVYQSNITHNLGKMADMAGIYKYLWRPEEVGISKASELIEPLEQGLGLLKTFPKIYRNYDPPNGWGNYDNLVEFVEKYLEACRENPDAVISVCR